MRLFPDIQVGEINVKCRQNVNNLKFALTFKSEN